MLIPADSSSWTPQAAAHLLNRAGFGGTPAEIEKLHALGREKAVDSLLQGADDSDRFPLPAWTKPEAMQQVAQQMKESRQAVEKVAEGAEREEKRRDMQRMMRQQQREQAIELLGLWMNRMKETPWPLREKMTLFWHGHFATSLEKVRETALMARQNDLFRRHALGSFKDLTLGITRDPAMMLYLDVNASRKQMPNENFARELMELFTLGEGHYTEEDIKQSARAFTGWQMRPFMPEARFVRQQHDDGEKTFFGKTGRFDSDAIVNIIFSQPQCAKFITGKLWKVFVSDTPPDSNRQEELAQCLIKSEWKTAPFLRAIFNSAAFYDPKVVRSQIKSPVQFLVQLSKHLELPGRLPPGPLGGALQELGQVPFRPPNVAGWDGGRAWINTNTLLSRYNIAGAVIKGEPGGLPAMQRGKGGKPDKKREREQRRARGGELDPPWDTIAPAELRREPGKLLDTLAWRFFNAPLAAPDRAKFEAFTKGMSGDGISNDDLAHLTHLMLSTPLYQIC